MHARVRLFAATAVLASLFPSIAIAQTPPPPTADAPELTAADAAKAQRDAAFEAKRFQKAIVAYDRAYAQRPDGALVFNRGRAGEGLGRYALALADFQALRRDAPPPMVAKVSGTTPGAHDRIPFYASAGIFVAAVGLGGAFSVANLIQYGETNDAIDRGALAEARIWAERSSTSQLVAIASGVVGVLALSTTLVFLRLESRSPSSSVRAVTLSVTPQAIGVGASF